MQKLSDLPMGKALVDGAQQLRERLDELGTRIRAIDPLEKRITELEQRLEALEKKSKPAAEAGSEEAEAGRLGHAQAQRSRDDCESDGVVPVHDGGNHVGAASATPLLRLAPRRAASLPPLPRLRCFPRGPFFSLRLEHALELPEARLRI